MNNIPAIISASVAFAIAAWLGWIVFTALCSGTACVAGGKIFKRKKVPVRYWVIVIVQLCFTLLFVLVGLKRLSSIGK